MGPAIFVIAILGCGEADGSCQQVSVAPTQYSSFAACTRATDDALARSEDVDFPVVVAQCKAAGTPASMQIKPSDIKLPDASPAREPGRILRTNYRPPAPQRG